jgi:hypothetical protein|tara:strand:- start:26 stop:232 length:207 start_codon:yes stop_codon:yes gene_type:complete
MNESNETSELSLIDLHLSKLYDISDALEIKNKALKRGYIDLSGNVTPSGKNMAKMVLADQSTLETNNH